MSQFVKELKNMWLTNTEIKDYLSWIDAGIMIANNQNVNKMNKQDHRAWESSSDALKKY